MSKHRIILSGVLIVLALGVLTPQFAQDVSTEQRHDQGLLVGLARTINTAEAVDFSKYGSYSSWQTVLSRHAEYFNGWLKSLYPNVHFGDTPEILPGWHLRLNANPDGQGYINVCLFGLSVWQGYASLAPEQLRHVNPDAVFCSLILLTLPLFALGTVGYSVRRWNVQKLRRPSLDRDPLNWWLNFTGLPTHQELRTLLRWIAATCHSFCFCSLIN